MNVEQYLSKVSLQATNDHQSFSLHQLLEDGCEHTGRVDGFVKPFN